MGHLGAPGAEEIYCDKDRAAAVAMGDQDIKTSLKVEWNIFFLRSVITDVLFELYVAFAIVEPLFVPRFLSMLDVDDDDDHDDINMLHYYMF